MPYQATHWATEPTRQAIDALQGANLLEFGTPWCGHCQGRSRCCRQHSRLTPICSTSRWRMARRPLGRSYRVKLWPTLIFLRDGGGGSLGSPRKRATDCPGIGTDRP